MWTATACWWLPAGCLWRDPAAAWDSPCRAVLLLPSSAGTARGSGGPGCQAVGLWRSPSSQGIRIMEMHPAWSRNSQLPSRGGQSRACSCRARGQAEQRMERVILALLSSPSPVPASLQCRGVGGEPSSPHRQPQPCPASLSAPWSWPSSRCHSVPPAPRDRGWGQTQLLAIRGADLGSHPAVLAGALWQSGTSLSLYPTPEVSRPGAHFTCAKQAGHCPAPQTSWLCPLWDRCHLRGPP